MIIVGRTVKIDLMENGTSNLIGLIGHKMVPDNWWLVHTVTDFWVL